MSLLPWSVALGVWKLANVAFLIGSVLLTFRLLQAYDLDTSDRYITCCFALVLSPTITVMTTGQTSLFVLFMLLLTSDALQRGRAFLAGSALALAMIKPQLAIAFALFLVLRRELRTVGAAIVCGAILTRIGLFLSHSDLGTYLDAVARYARYNTPTSHIAVGIASLLAHLTSLSFGSATLVGMIVGILV